MKIKNTTLTEMKILVSNIEKCDTIIRQMKNLFIMQGFKLEEYQILEEIKTKKLKKKYQKQINNIIKSI
jgi:hypothetical protein